MRIGDRRLLEILVHRRAAFLVTAFDFDRHLCATGLLPLDLLVLMDQRLVLLRIDLHFEVMRRGLGTDARDDLHRFAGRQLAIHPCR